MIIKNAVRWPSHVQFSNYVVTMTAESSGPVNIGKIVVRDGEVLKKAYLVGGTGSCLDSGEVRGFSSLETTLVLLLGAGGSVSAASPSSPPLRETWIIFYVLLA